MKHRFTILLAALTLCVLTACGTSAPANEPQSTPPVTQTPEQTQPETPPAAEKTEQPADLPQTNGQDTEEPSAMENEYQITITVGDTVLNAVLEKNATTDALVEQMPLTLSMLDLYGREMCYRYGAGALPTDTLRSDGYQVGDIAYWPPRGSLVILYAQNGEQFERQHLGHISEGVEVFETTGDTEVTFSLAGE